MSLNRPAVVAQKNFLLHRDALMPLNLEQKFEYIYHNNLWSSNESCSGLGSSSSETATLKTELPQLLTRLQAQSVLDAPCGDCAWIRGIDLQIPYIGVDIVREIVVENFRKKGGDRWQFLHLNIVSDPLPACDAILCRDCLVHFSFANIFATLRNFQSSGARWILATHFVHCDENIDITDGDWRPLNLQAPPFNLPQPAHVLIENCREGGGAYDDKTIAAWDLTQLRF